MRVSVSSKVLLCCPGELSGWPTCVQYVHTQEAKRQNTRVIYDDFQEGAKMQTWWHQHTTFNGPPLLRHSHHHYHTHTHTHAHDLHITSPTQTKTRTLHIWIMNNPWHLCNKLKHRDNTTHPRRNHVLHHLVFLSLWLVQRHLCMRDDAVGWLCQK